jgi:hypothetical protein
MTSTEPRPRRARSAGARRRSPHEGVFARIGLSRIHGVGVLAIRDIPAGVAVFRGESERVVWVSRAVVRKLPAELRRLYTDFAMVWGDRLGVPYTLNMLSVGWYLNHSEEPNVEADDDGRFHSLRRIRKGEELTADYRTFSDDALTFRTRAEQGERSPSRSARAGERRQRVASGAGKERGGARRIDARDRTPRRARANGVAERQLRRREP